MIQVVKCEGCKELVEAKDSQQVGIKRYCNDCCLERLTDMGYRWGEVANE